jgi:OmpA-OmpF porin, OOP family
LPKRIIAKLPHGVQRQLPQTLTAVGAFVVAAIIAGGTAWVSALVIERRTTQVVTSKLLDQGITWATPQADGLQLRLIGTAPNEAARFRAVNLVGTVIESSRIRDMLDVTPVKAIEAPRFSVEMLRNDDGIQLIGLLPAGDDLDKLRADAGALDNGAGVSDMLETASYPAPEGWNEALAYGVSALKLLPRSKVSVASDSVVITAIADSAAEQRLLESELARSKPDGLKVEMDVSAPRPVLTPFTLRFVRDGQGARFDACSADTDRARTSILAAGVAAGVQGKATCTIGLGVPTPRWADAVSKGIKAVQDLGNATITFSDADVSLVAADSVTQSAFDRVVGELQSALPEVFSLDATLERKASAPAAGPAEFTATLSTDGKLELRGRLTDPLLREAVDSFAQARFGVGNVLVATRLDDTLPDGWPVRVLAGLESLAELANGKLVVRADTVQIEGVTGSQNAKARISQVLSDKLGQGQTFKVSVTYDEELDPLAALPTPQECADKVQATLSKRKISFAPGSAEIDGASSAIMDRLAETLEKCPDVQMQVAGYTDSQGSEEGNRALSQARAEAVVLALQGRGVSVDGLTAKGFGEADPIADNGTEAGREANRRIEFSLLGAPARPDTQAPDAREDTAADATPTGAEATDDALNDANPPDFTGDDSPSVAPTQKTLRPKPRPKDAG